MARVLSFNFLNRYYKFGVGMRTFILNCVLMLLLISPSLRAVQTIHLPMTDGTKLVTDIHTPEGEGPWPVLLMRSTYGRSVGGPSEVREGYTVVIQDVRGMGESEGEKHVFYADGWRDGMRDGADTVEWILRQPWCNGKVGTLGGSALAITQMLLAPATQQLHAQYIEAGCANLYTDVAYKGGVWQKNLLEGWLEAIKQPHIIQTYKSHPYYDSYWESFDTLRQTASVTSPALFVGAWQDIFCQGTIDAFVQRERNGGEGARGNNMLIMKWGVHGPDTSKDYTFNENRFDLKISQIRSAFFRYWLQGDAAALKPYPKVHYYVLGADTPGAPGNGWRTAETWPLPGVELNRYFLHHDFGLTEEGPIASSAARTYVFDPRNPVPTHGGANLLMPSGPYDQREVSGRGDVLEFRSSPLGAPLEIAGQVKVSLFVSSSAPDTDFTAKLVDIYPEGDDREILMLDGIQRVKLRARQTPGLITETGKEILKEMAARSETLLRDETEVVKLEIDLESTAWVFNTGHRIGLQISSSNYPRFEVNPNTGEDFPGEKLETARNSVHLDQKYPSYLELPVRGAHDAEKP